MNKKIGLLMRCENTSFENNYYIKAIEKYGGDIVYIYDNDNISLIYKKLKGVSGILLTGGDNVGRVDYLLIKYALTNNLKLLGICQGMQSMALYGTSNKLISIGNDSHKQKEGYIHDVFIKNGRLYSIIGTYNIKVDSHHLQTVSSSKYFNIVGYSNDLLIEAVENSNHKFQIGVQWHPERMFEYDEVSRKIFNSFINS